jgi:hypothetical protein
MAGEKIGGNRDQVTVNGSVSQHVNAYLFAGWRVHNTYVNGAVVVTRDSDSTRYLLSNKFEEDDVEDLQSQEEEKGSPY